MKIAKMADVDVAKLSEFIEMILPMEYRCVVEHHQIMQFFGFEIRNAHYYSRLRQANRILLEKGKMLRNVSGVGYEVIHPDDYIDVAGVEFKCATRRMQRGDRIRNSAPTDKMTKEGLNRHRMVSDRLSTVSQFMSERKRDVFQLMNASLPKHNRTFERLPVPQDADES